MLPQAEKSWTLAEAAHLLNRAGFGGSPDEITALHALGRAGQGSARRVERALLLAEPPFVPPPHSWDPPGLGEGQTLGRGGFMGWLLDPQYRPENRADWYRKWNYWMMSQRGGTLSYLVFSGGFSLFVYVLFYVACDIFGWSLGIFRSFGVNALAAYILHGMVGSAIGPFVPKDAPGWYMTASVLLFFIVNWVIIRHLEKQRIFLKL